MPKLNYRPVAHDHADFLNKANKREGFRKAYQRSEPEYSFVREMLAARIKSNLTQEEVAKSMGTTKSAVSRLESAGKHVPSLRTLKKYAEAVGCRLEVKLIPGLYSVRTFKRAK